MRRRTVAGGQEAGRPTAGRIIPRRGADSSQDTAGRTSQRQRVTWRDCGLPPERRRMSIALPDCTESAVGRRRCTAGRRLPHLLGVRLQQPVELLEFRAVEQHLIARSAVTASYRLRPAPDSRPSARPDPKRCRAAATGNCATIRPAARPIPGRLGPVRAAWP